jgi:outer membrane protein assembly factor BamA
MAVAILCAGQGLAPSPAEARKRRPPRPVQVRKIHINTQNVFDLSVQGENYWPYRIANRLHIRTHAAVIRQQLLMRERDWIALSEIDESERALRALPFIRDAQIVTVAGPKNQVDLWVKTKDSWTTQPQINFGSEGNQSTFGAGIEEDNLFGYGKSFSYFYKKKADGIHHSWSYNDPQFLNHRLLLATLFADTPKGNEQHVSFSRPFYSYETRSAAGVSVDRVLGEQVIFENGKQINNYRSDALDSNLFAARRVNEDLSDVQRLWLRYRFTKTLYNTETGTQESSMPPDKTIAGPQGTWSRDQSDFIKENHIDKEGRVEDINLGHETRVVSGYSGRLMSATENSLPYAAVDRFGFGGDADWFGLVSYGILGRYNLYRTGQLGGRLLNTLYFANVNLYRHLMKEFPLTGVFHMEAAHVQNPDTQNVLQLGGDTGLRGYKVQAFTGNKAILMNLESRFFLPYEIFHLGYVGGATFMDAGEARPYGSSFNHREMHVDIGVGLRVGLSRSTEGTVYRFDVAYAIGPTRGEDRVIFSISSGQGFKREGNTYGSYSSAAVLP